MDFARAVHLIEQDRHARRGGIAIAVDVDAELLRRDVRDTAARLIDDAVIRLVRDNQRDILAVIEK